MALDLWGEEIVVAEAPKKKQRRRAESDSYRRRPAYCSENNDIDSWFRENNPETLAECEDVRKALRKKSQVGNYGADSYIAKTGLKLLRVKGPVSNVMIVSAAARKYFNKKLRSREVYLETLLKQFGSEQVTFKPKTS
jgi:hypothetical protein